MSSPSPASQTPFRIKKYECIEYLGGNMADVYRARDPKANREVVIKVLKAEYCRDRELRLRFTQEAQMGCRCSHPNVVVTYDTDEENGRPYIVMEYLSGESLRAFMQRGAIETQEEAIWIGLQLAQALECLHSLDIIHRDLKPENVHVDGTGNAKLLDFGVAHLKNSRLTQTGQRIGTPLYMSPEQVTGQELTPASDIYSLGVLLFELLTLESPYHARTEEELLGAIVRARPNFELLGDCQVPTEVIQCIQRCLVKDPKRRYQSCVEICNLLGQFVSAEHAARAVSARVRQSSTARRRRAARIRFTIATTLVLVAAVAITVWLVSRPLPTLLNMPSGDMVLVQGGVALLGADARPMRVNSFYIDKTEVSNGIYLSFCRQSGHSIPPAAEQQPEEYPIVNVTFYDAQAFAKWAGKRLPSAEEWEKAARGSRSQKFPWGDEWRDDAANVPSDRVAARAATLAVVTGFASGASPYGALNMIGNAWEWVDTRVHVDDKQFELLKRSHGDYHPPLSRDESFYQVRGGSYRWVSPARSQASLVFDYMQMPARDRERDLGFRCAKNP